MVQELFTSHKEESSPDASHGPGQLQSYAFSSSQRAATTDSRVNLTLMSTCCHGVCGLHPIKEGVCTTNEAQINFSLLPWKLQG